MTSQLNTDPGLGGAPPAVPALGPLALAVLLALLGAAAVVALRRGDLA